MEGTCKPDPVPVRVAVIHLEPPSPAVSSNLPEGFGRAAYSAFLFGLAPRGVYLATSVTGECGELLPRRFTLAILR